MIPREVDAFRFGMEPCPEWFESMMSQGSAVIYYNDKHDPLAKITWENNLENTNLEAKKGDWIVYDPLEVHVVAYGEFVKKYHPLEPSEQFDQSCVDSENDAFEFLKDHLPKSEAWDNIDANKYVSFIRGYSEECFLIDPSKGGKCFCDACGESQEESEAG